MARDTGRKPPICLREGSQSRGHRQCSTPDVIAYCRIGERSSHTWFVLHELLGFDRVRNYDGSWTEYGSLVGVPIEKSVPVAVPA
jgi:3-mercaptopyruvate sulfurtransferase SseA